MLDEKRWKGIGGTTESAGSSVCVSGELHLCPESGLILWNEAWPSLDRGGFLFRRRI